MEAGRLALASSVAGRHFRLHRLPALVQHRRVASATSCGVPPRRSPPFSSLSFLSQRLGGATASNRFTSSSSSLYNSEGFSHAWDAPPLPGDGVVAAPHEGAVFDDGAAWTAVLLGWLGAEQKHLRRYAEIYRGRGMRAVSFVVPVGGVLRDLGRGVEERIARFAGELAAWAEGVEADGRERRLVFHTFSNTGWYTYGAILENLKSRGDVIQKIKGCVIDSGADAEINPKVWAAGFCAALLKKRSSLIYVSVEPVEQNVFNGDTSRLMPQNARPDCIEFVLLSILEKFFMFILGRPDVNQRLNKVISTLSNNQPPCPQLYLYSSTDKVIPVRSVELFIQGQKGLGREVWAYDFVSSPHVDHFRTFPHIYSAKLDEFLKECLAVTQKQMASQRDA